MNSSKRLFAHFASLVCKGSEIFHEKMFRFCLIVIGLPLRVAGEFGYFFPDNVTKLDPVTQAQPHHKSKLKGINLALQVFLRCRVRSDGFVAKM